MTIIISQKILEKLKNKHSVSETDVHQCFANRTGCYLFDPREEHASNPPTEWFISETDYGVKLKIVFIFRDGKVYLRTAFRPNENEISIYNQKALK